MAVDVTHVVPACVRAAATETTHPKSLMGAAFDQFRRSGAWPWSAVHAMWPNARGPDAFVRLLCDTLGGGAAHIFPGASFGVVRVTARVPLRRRGSSFRLGKITPHARAWRAPVEEVVPPRAHARFAGAAAVTTAAPATASGGVAGGAGRMTAGADSKGREDF